MSSEFFGDLKFGFWRLQPLNPGHFGIGRSISESRSIVEGMKWVASVKTSEERNWKIGERNLENSTTLVFYFERRKEAKTERRAVSKQKQDFYFRDSNEVKRNSFQKIGFWTKYF